VLVGTLFAFKYVPWVLSAVGIGLPKTAGWIVPLGLSFTVFRLIGILMDGQALKAAVTAGDVLFLAVFFPSFRSGPITTVQQVTQIGGAGRSQHWPDALKRIATGLFRKAVLADPLHALVIAPWLAQGVSHLSSWQAALLPAAFGFYVYWDFAGYTDIAIGVAALLGYRLPENFDRPYLSASLLDFWRRWHITLSEWIRTRLMMKMVGRRSPKWHVYLAIVVSMTLCGLWHGAGLNFLIWGLWHALGIVGVHLFGELQRRSAMVRRVANAPWAAAVCVALTFTFVSLGWLLFFLPLADAIAVARQVLLWRYTAGALTLLCLILSAVPAVERWLGGRPNVAFARVPSIVRGSMASVACALILYFLLFHQASQQEFVYAQF
jgi:alginate O-acetyltransferase complex protein AlgI